MERSAEAAAGHPGDSRYLVELVQSSLDDDKAEDIVVIDLAGRSSIADYMVVASGRSTRQVGAIAEKLRERLKAVGYNHVSVEGQQTCDWVVIDALDVVVHIKGASGQRLRRLFPLGGRVRSADACQVCSRGPERG